MLHGFCLITPHQTGPAQDMHFGLHACVYTSQGLSYSKRWSVPSIYMASVAPFTHDGQNLNI